MSSAAPPSTRSPLAAFAAVFLLAAACAGALVWTLERQERAQQRTQAADVAGDHVQALQRAIELALSANNTLVALVRQGHGNVPQFEEIGMQMLPFYPGIAAMGLSPGGVVQQVVPRAGNENLLGFDQLNDPRQGAESARARESGLLTLAGPWSWCRAAWALWGASRCIWKMTWGAATSGGSRTSPSAFQRCWRLRACRSSPSGASTIDCGVFAPTTIKSKPSRRLTLRPLTTLWAAH